MPDAQLLSLASQGKLQDDATIAAQVTRMLKDPKGAAMTDVFVGRLAATFGGPGSLSPDPTTFPMVTPALKQSMVQQSLTFFRNVLTTGAPISHSLSPLTSSMPAWRSSMACRPPPEPDSAK